MTVMAAPDYFQLLSAQPDFSVALNLHKQFISKGENSNTKFISKGERHAVAAKLAPEHRQLNADACLRQPQRPSNC
jgi:hypothetical protein